MGLAPETIRNFLYPDYQGSAMLQESLGPDNGALTAIVESEMEEEEDDDSLKQDAQQLRARYFYSFKYCIYIKVHEGRWYLR